MFYYCYIVAWGVLLRRSVAKGKPKNTGWEKERGWKMWKEKAT